MSKVVKAVEWMWSVCQYIYDLEFGDPRCKIPLSTSFEYLPNDWVCPVCRAGKEKFFDI